MCERKRERNSEREEGGGGGGGGERGWGGVGASDRDPQDLRVPFKETDFHQITCCSYVELLIHSVRLYSKLNPCNVSSVYGSKMKVIKRGQNRVQIGDKLIFSPIYIYFPRHLC